MRSVHPDIPCQSVHYVTKCFTMQCFYACCQGAWELSDEYQIFLWQSYRYIYNTTSYFIMQFLYTCGQGPWGALMGVRFYWPCSPVFFLGPKFPFAYLAAIGGWSIEARVWLWAVLSCGPSVLLSLWPCFLGSVGCSLLAGLQAYGLSPCWELIPPAQKLYHENVFCDMLLYY